MWEWKSFFKGGILMFLEADYVRFLFKMSV